MAMFPQKKTRISRALSVKPPVCGSTRPPIRKEPRLGGDLDLSLVADEVSESWIWCNGLSISLIH